jgi:hypothetical protein
VYSWNEIVQKWLFLWVPAWLFRGVRTNFHHIYNRAAAAIIRIPSAIKIKAGVPTKLPNLVLADAVSILAPLFFNSSIIAMRARVFRNYAKRT